jgi:diguanylate cyclase (GGDEF)-like protein
MDCYEEIKAQNIVGGVSTEQLILDHTHTYVIEHFYDTDTYSMGICRGDLIDFDWNQIPPTHGEALRKIIYKPDIPMFEKFMDISDVNCTIHRNMNIRLYVVPHIYEWFRLTLICYVNDEGIKEKSLLMITNAERELETVQQLRNLVKMDYLTQLPNIDTFSMQTREMIKVNHGTEFTIIRMDMSKFRFLNEFYGTKEGDNVLRYMAVKIQECLDMENMATYCHLSSDVFAVCVERDDERIKRVIHFMQDSMNKYPLNFDMVMSFGIYHITQKDKNEMTPIVTLVDRAGIAQRVKTNYMNHIALFDDEIAAKEKAEQNVIMEMNNALESNQFHIYLQPKTDMLTGKIVGSEALVRWIHPTKGLISPSDFVPIFESNGFVTELDRYMLKSVCKMIRSWIDRGVPAYPVSLNLSRANLHNPDLFDDIMHWVTEYDVPHELLEFEITESSFVADNKYFVDLVEHLQGDGFHVLMDDFGSGFSSLNALRELSVDVLKIDIKFLPISEKDNRADIILKSIVNMANKLKLGIVVEGVETEHQAELLKSIGCRVAQGFLYYRPMPVEEYEKNL